MSHRLSCLSTDFGLHLIRTIASFFSSVFVCQRYASTNQSARSATGLKEFSESGVECGGHTSSSSRSSSSSSISSSLRYSTSSSEFATGRTNANSTAITPPTIVLTTPRGHRHQKSRSHSRSKSRNSRLADFCNLFNSDNDDLSEFDEDEDDMELTNPDPANEKKVKITDKELNRINRKIKKLLVKLDEEYETEIATSPDEECVICINAKATMQTYPCGHRVVCRKCFVKTIQMVVTQRMLPLRCVICRAKVLRLKQTTTGGLSTGFVRSNSKHQSHNLVGGGLSRPASLMLATDGLHGWANHLSPSTPTRSPTSPLTEVFQAQKALYELQYRAVNPLGKPYSELELEQEGSFNDNLDRDDLSSSMGEPVYDASWDTSMRVGRRLQQYFVDSANNNSIVNQHQHPAARRHLESLRCNSCGSSPVTTMNGMESFHPSLVSSVGSSHSHSCDWVDSSTVQQLPAQTYLDADTAWDPNNNAVGATVQYHSPTLMAPHTDYLLPWSLHRKRKHARYLQHRRWYGLQQQRLPLQLLNAQQQFVQLPLGVLKQPPAKRSQEIGQHAFIQVENLGPWQRRHSFLGPISEEDEDRLQWNENGWELEQQPETQEIIDVPRANTIKTPQSQHHSHHSLHYIPPHSELDTKPSAFTKHHKKSHRKCSVIRKSRSEPNYIRLNDSSIEENNDEKEAFTEPNSDVESDTDQTSGRRQSSHSNGHRSRPSTLSSRLRQSSSSLTSLISSTIHESFKMFRSFKLH